MKKWMTERFFARLRGVFAAGCLCGGLLGLPSVTWAQTFVDGGVVSVKTIEVAEGESQTLEPQSGLDQVCKMGQGILVVAPESVADWTGTLYVMEGTLDVGAVRALPKLAFSEGTALLVTETREDDGEIFLAESTGAPSVRLQRLNGGVAEGA